jgi:hypothetical protein
MNPHAALNCATRFRSLLNRVLRRADRLQAAGGPSALARAQRRPVHQERPRPSGRAAGTWIKQQLPISSSAPYHDGRVGRKKWVWHDLPPRMKARRLASGKVLYYYQAAGKQTPLGSNLITPRKNGRGLRAEPAGTRWPQITKLYRASVFPSLAIGTRAHYKIALDNLDLTFKKATLEQIEPRHVKGYMRKRTKKGAAVFRAQGRGGVLQLGSRGRPYQGAEPVPGSRLRGRGEEGVRVEESPIRHGCPVRRRVGSW